MGLRIFFAGDVVVSANRETDLVAPDMAKIIKNCDVACCNFEAPVSEVNQKPSPKIGPSLSQNSHTAELLKRAGFNLFSIANNHIMDYGKNGLIRTLKAFEELGVPYIGAGLTSKEVYAPYIVEHGNLKVGVIAVAENGFGSHEGTKDSGYAWFGAEEFEETLHSLKEICDHIIVICHGGAEKWDWPLPEYRKLYKKWIDEGVTAVVAHHPHVPQGWEEYKNGFIFYSLGNFAFDKGFGIQNPETISVILNFEEKKIGYEIIKSKFTEKGIVLDESDSFEEHLKRCNSVLKSSTYIDTVNKKCVSQFEKHYMGYYLSVANIYTGSLKRILKTIYFKIIKRERFSELWLYHNLEIETHYWICRRAMNLRRKELSEK